MKLSLRPIAPNDVVGAYATYLSVFDWLAEKGVRQWLRPVELESFFERQSRGELLGCFAGFELAAVVTLGFEASPYWTEEIGGEPRWWIKSLAVSPRFRGAGIGAFSMAECERAVGNAGAEAVFLDCVDAGFLPGYYAKAGLWGDFEKGNHVSVRELVSHGANEEKPSAGRGGGGPVGRPAPGESRTSHSARNCVMVGR